jgi:branched-chain amino acid transport system permease protein
MTLLFAGLSVGSVYAIVALLYNVTYASAGVFNFAQAQMLMVGAFSAYVGATVWKLPTILTVVFGAAVGALIGYVSELATIRFLGSRVAEGALVTTIGCSVALDGLALVIFGTNTRGVTLPGPDNPIQILGAYTNRVDITIIVTAIVLGLVLHFVSRHTRWGLATRAATEDSDAARMRGINVRRLSSYGFALAGAIAGGLGIIVGAKVFATYNVADPLVVYGFVALIIGGFGSYLGSLAGGLLIGVLLEVGSRYIGVDYPPLILFGVLVLILLIRPSGLISRTGARVV